MLRDVENGPVSSQRVKPILVLGIGNILLRDEGVGVRVVEALRGCELPENVELFDGATAGIDLVDVVCGRDRILVIDAIDADCEPGTVVELTGDALAPKPAADLSLHDIGLLEALHLACHLGQPPREVVLFGVKPAEVDWGLELSGRIGLLVPELARLVCRKVESWIALGPVPRDKISGVVT